MKLRYGGNSSQAVTYRFPQVGGNRTTEASDVIFRPHSGHKGVETPPPMTPTTSLSPPVGGRCFFRRDWLANICPDMLNFSPMVLPFISTKTSQNSCDSVTIKGPSRPNSGLLYPVSSVKYAIERVENVNLLGSTVTCF